MIKTSELKLKEIVNITNGQQLGMIEDIDIDLSAGKIKGIIVPKEDKMFGLFGGKEELYISWDDIYTIGEDVILVKLNGINDAMPKDSTID